MNVSITGEILREKAQKIADELELTDWECSNSWISRRKTRYNICLKMNSGESSAVNMNVVKDNVSTVLPRLLEGNERRKVFHLTGTVCIHDNQAVFKKTTHNFKFIHMLKSGLLLLRSTIIPAEPKSRSKSHWNSDLPFFEILKVNFLWLPSEWKLNLIPVPFSDIGVRS